MNNEAHYSVWPAGCTPRPLLLSADLRVSSDWYHAPARIMGHEILLVTDGRVTLFLDEQPYHLKAGDVLFIRQGQMVCSDHPPRTPFVCSFVMFTCPEPLLQIEPQAMKTALETACHAENLPNTPGNYFILPETMQQAVYLPDHCQSDSHLAIMMSLLRAMQDERDRPDWNTVLAIGLRIQMLLLIMTRISARHVNIPRQGIQIPKLVQEAVFFIHEHVKEPLSVARLATHLRISRQHLIRLFRTHLAMTPVHYIHRLRIDQAQVLLSQSNMSIKEVAHACGFQNVNYFIRLFRRFYGHTPGTYATRQRQRITS